MQARCPGCNALLRIPAEHVNATLRCKRCGTRLQARPRAAAKKASAADTGAPTPDVTTAANVAPPSLAPVAPPPQTGGEPELPFSHLDNRFSKITEHYRTRRRKRWKPVAIAMMAIAAIGIALLCMPGVRSNLTDMLNSKTTDPMPTVLPGKRPVAAPAVRFPRRILAISINNYLYAAHVNPGWAGGDPREGRVRLDHSVHGIFRMLSQALDVPEDQRTELSDSILSAAPSSPSKPVIESAVGDFLTSSRAQDRILILFVGHAVDVGGQAYLVPIEGEPGKKDTLIPLAWLYEQLSKCKARQKALIMDVCRFDPSHPQEQPGTGPMSPKLDAALANPPPGVQVWSACVGGQRSYEGFLPPSADAGTGGLFLNELYEALAPYDKHIGLGIPRPEDPLPLELLANGGGDVKGVNKNTEAEVAGLYHRKQTPRLAGQESAGGAPYEPAEPPAAKVVLRSLAGDFVDRELIAGILNDVGPVPPLRKSQQDFQPLAPETLSFLSVKALGAYRDDGKSTTFREAIRKTVKLLQDEQIARSFMDEFRGKGTDAAIKERILAQQRKPAIIQSDLEDSLAQLKKAGEERDREPSRRWQANYDYVLALLEARIAYVYEYNYMLGQIRKDALPPRDPAKHSGWRLVSQEKLQSGAEAKKMAAASRKLLDKIIKDHPGTPYEVLAKREKMNPLGLEWQPTR
jgi:hypothetical protein